MTLLTLLKYLIGNRQAILDIANSRGAIVAGLLFVLAAGLAREYDGEYLLREPWHLLLPLGASLATATILYLLLQVLLFIRGGSRDESGRWQWLPFRSFLSLYWMTAPLALLYGIPVERFLSAGDATRANLALLAIVSLWRVLLMTRVLSVLYQVSFFRTLFPVMLFADSVALLLLQIVPMPIFAIMGGIRLSESEGILLEVSLITGALGFLSWPVWLIGALAASNASWRLHPDVTESRHPPSKVALHIWATCAAAILGWLIVLPFTQTEQSLRYQAESDLRAGRIREALLLMSQHEQSDFPPHWDPPPRLAFGERKPDLADVQEHVDVMPVKPWVRTVYVEKFSNHLRGDDMMGIWWQLSEGEVERRISLIERLPERNQIVRDNEHGLGYALDPASPELRARIQKLLDDAREENEDQP